MLCSPNVQNYFFTRTMIRYSILSFGFLFGFANNWFGGGKANAVLIN